MIPAAAHSVRRCTRGVNLPADALARAELSLRSPSSAVRRSYRFTGQRAALRVLRRSIL